MILTLTGFEPPRLRTNDDRGRHATWLELFFDLVFVVSIARLAYQLGDDISVAGVLTFAALFVPVWWAWVGSTFYANRFDTDDFEYRLLTTLEMIAVIGLAINVTGGLTTNAAGFALAYAGVRGVLVLKYLRAYHHVPAARPLTRRYALGFGADAMLWTLSAFVPEPYRYALWIAGLTVSFLTPITAGRLHLDFVPHREHLPERFGLFIIIVLGESLVGIVSGIEHQGATTAIGALLAVTLAVILAMSCWWLYFEHIGDGPIEAAVQLGRSWVYQVWLYAHLPLTASLAAVGVGIEHLVEANMGVAPAADRWLLAGAVAVYLIALCGLGIVGIHVGHNQAHLLPAALSVGAAAVLVVAAVGGAVPAVVVLGAIGCIVALEVLADTIVNSTIRSSEM
ncbi:low temperature requirement protein A (plasmid) [Haloferacaceae archaeon DSL9]